MHSTLIHRESYLIVSLKPMLIARVILGPGAKPRLSHLIQAVRIDAGNVLYWRNAVALMTAGGDESRAAATWQQLVAMDPQGAMHPQGGPSCVNPKNCFIQELEDMNPQQNQVMIVGPSFRLMGF